MQYGIRGVTMDDVSSQSSISKKTLYQLFENKDELVTEAVKKHFEMEREEFKEIRAQSSDAIHELILTAQCIRKHVLRTNPALLLDMQKFHKKAWSEYIDFKHDTIKRQIEDNIYRGIKEGFFRKEMDAQILAIFRIESVQLVFSPKIFPYDQFDFPTVQLQIMDHFIHGLLTTEGRKKYEAYNQLENQKTQTTI